MYTYNNYYKETYINVAWNGCLAAMCRACSYVHMVLKFAGKDTTIGINLKGVSTNKITVNQYYQVTQL